MGPFSTIKWARFRRTLPYLQKLFGYCLTGCVDDQILPFLYGHGDNGKSTLVSTFMALLGDHYSLKAPQNLLVINSNNEIHPEALAKTFRKRLVIGSEIKENQRLNEALIKELTGGEVQTARNLYENSWSFNPTAKIWMFGNAYPRIVGNDHGIWKRLKVIHFEHQIKEEDKDKSFGTKLQGELSGILNWAIEGCHLWQQDGTLKDIDSIKFNTGELRRESDEVREFVEQHCIIDMKYKIGASFLFGQFKLSYPESNINQRNFGQRLKQMGCLNTDPKTNSPVRLTGGASAWLGIRLKTKKGRVNLVNLE